tara:strand:+ start:537 stop:1205 length:669 start_codon:yes stop_codon:yes gene_type:complete
MSSVIVNLSDTFEQWRVKTNSIGSQSGDLSTLSTTAKGSLVDAINEIASNDSDDMENLIDDTTPQLGGNLDLNNFNIINSGVGQSTITVTGSVTAGSFIGEISVESDPTPRLGANLDLNNNVITGTGSINITGMLTASSIAGTVTGTTQSPNDNSTKLATTEYVDAQVATENTIMEMDDTTINAPVNGQQLVYNSTTSKWENTTAAVGATQGFAVAVAVALG